MGKGLVEGLEREFDLQVEWLGIEIHPETPQEGTPITSMFRQQDVQRMMKHLRAMGTPLGIGFADIERIANSRLAHQTAEFARESGRFDDVHSAIFSAYFSNGLDIGDREVIMQIAQDAGLDTEGLDRALQEERYLPRLQNAQEEAARLGVTGVPTFFLDGKRSLVGAQPLEVFRKALQSLR